MPLPGYPPGPGSTRPLSRTAAGLLVLIRGAGSAGGPNQRGRQSRQVAGRVDQPGQTPGGALSGWGSGSYLALYDGVNTDKAKVEAEAAYADTGAVAYHNRSPEQIGRFFEGLDLVDPGLVSISQWRLDPPVVGTVQPTGSYGAVARKP